MNIREYDPLLYQQLRLCLEGDYVGPAADELTPAMRSGLLRSLDEEQVGEACRCGQSDCHSFDTMGTRPTSSSRRVRFRVHGELAVICADDGRLQRVEWLPDPPRAIRRCYENAPDGFVQREICPFPQ